jgi:hypothetical protein
MERSVVPIFVHTYDGIRELRGGGHVDGMCVDIYRDVGPGEAFAGVAYDELTDGTYAFDLATGTLARTAERD